MVNASGSAVDKFISLEGIKKVGDKATVFSLKSDDLFTINSFDEPQKIAPVTSQLDVKGKKFSYKLPAYSFTVIRLKVSPMPQTNTGRMNNANP